MKLRRAHTVPQQGDGTITFEVIIEVLESPPKLLLGMSADVDIIVMQRDDVLQLPIDAVIDSEVLMVKGDVPTQDLGRFNSDQEVEVENLIGKKFPGKVGKIWPAKTRSNVENLLDGTPWGLRTGPTAVHVLFSDTDRIEGIEAEIESEQKYFVLLDKEAPQEDTRKKKKTKDKKEKKKGIRTRIEVGERKVTLRSSAVFWRVTAYLCLQCKSSREKNGIKRGLRSTIQKSKETGPHMPSGILTHGPIALPFSAIHNLKSTNLQSEVRCQC